MKQDERFTLTDKVILVIGNFDVLHPGHIRLLKFAKECGDKLIVAVNSNDTMPQKNRVDQQHRLEMVSSLAHVDHAFITKASATELILQLKPYAVVKGKEFENTQNPEQEALYQYGGKLIFGSGEFETNSEQYLKRTASLGGNYNFTDAHEYAKRHQITQLDLHSIIAKFSQQKIAVIGEVIVDEYVHGTAIGLSQEDPTIVMTPEKSELFLGGAAITAGHIKSLGAKAVTLISVIGEDEKAEFVEHNIKQFNLTSCLFRDSSRPTPLKSRYRASSKTLLRVNQVRQHKISRQLQQEILAQISDLLAEIDTLVFSDFNYGLLPQGLVDEISVLCAHNGVNIVADSQTSSQVGDISRYRNTTLLTPTEKEVRVALNNPDDGLVILADKLCQKSHPEYLVITLASEGVFIHVPDYDNNSWENDSLPAFNNHALDPAGAGDCFLATSTLALCSGATPWQAFYLANLASACQVSKVGNIPLQLDDLTKLLDRSLN